MISCDLHTTDFNEVELSDATTYVYNYNGHLIGKYPLSNGSMIRCKE